MTFLTKKQEMLARIEEYGRNLLAVFPRAAERDPVKLCKRLRRLEREAAAIGLQLSNGPEMSEGEQEQRVDTVLAKVNKLLGNRHEYQPKTGAKCSCKRGVQRDNCQDCEGTGLVIDFAAIRSRTPLVPVFVNLDPRGYALKIRDEWMAAHPAVRLPRDSGWYGILAPDLRD